MLCCVACLIARVSCKCGNLDPSNMARVNLDNAMCGSPCVAVINAGIDNATACMSITDGALWEDGRCITRCEDMVGHSKVLFDKDVWLCRSAAGVYFEQYNGSLVIDSGVSYTLPIACRCSDWHKWYTYGPKLYFFIFSMDSIGFKSDVDFCRYGYWALGIAEMFAAIAILLLFILSIVFFLEGSTPKNVTGGDPDVLKMYAAMCFVSFISMIVLLPYSVLLWAIFFLAVACSVLLYFISEVFRFLKLLLW